MKFCKDCRHFELSGYSGNNSRCNAPETNAGSYSDPITGEAIQHPRDDSIYRKSGWLVSIIKKECGKSARWFEPIESTRKG